MAGSRESGWLNARRADGPRARDTMMMMMLFDSQVLFFNTSQKLMTQHPSLFTPISYCAIAFSFALMFTNNWFCLVQWLRIVLRLVV